MTEIENHIICEMPRDIRLIVPPDDHIGRVYEKGNWYEGQMLDFIRRHLGANLTFIDVGAYIGGHSIYFSRICGAKEVFAFEPNPESYALLKQNIEINRLRNITALDYALGDATRRGEIVEIADGNQGHTVICKKSKGPVAIKKLDTVMRKFSGVRVNVIKIDAEGTSREILRGASGIIKKHRPHIFVETQDKEELCAVDGFIMAEFPWYGLRETFNSTPTRYYRSNEAKV